MSKKLIDNGLWDTSRMMQQHRDSIQRKRIEETRIKRTRIDEEEAHLMATMLMQSQVHGQLIEVTIYGDFQPKKLTGKVTSHQREAFRLLSDTTSDTSEWVRFKDLIKVELVNQDHFFG